MNQVVIDRFVSSGLEYNEERRLFSYSDVYSNLLFKEVQTITDQDELPMLAIFTSKPGSDTFEHQGHISHSYQFYGNEAVVTSIKEGIESSNSNAHVVENPILNSKFTVMSNELILSNAVQSFNDQDICPLISVINSYDGNVIVNVSFGLGIISENSLSHSISFRNSLGTYRQIHMKGSKAHLYTTIGEGIELISNNIQTIIRDNFSRPLTEELMLSTLGVVEDVGKRRRESIETTIKELQKENRTLTVWDLFLAITKFSCNERNINAKLLLESVVERLLVLPTDMINFVKKAA